MSLAEVRASLEDIVRFELQPLDGFIRSNGLSKDPRTLGTYFENQLFQIKLDRQQAAYQGSAPAGVTARVPCFSAAA